MSKPKYTAHINTIQCNVSNGFVPSVIFRAANFKTSSSNTTGIENFITVTHSSVVNGVTWKTVYINGRNETKRKYAEKHCVAMARKREGKILLFWSFDWFTFEWLRLHAALQFAIATYWEYFDVKNDKVKCEWKSHWTNQPHVLPWWHGNERLIFR